MLERQSVHLVLNALEATVKETLKNDPISLFPPLESVIFDLAARFNPFLGSFWVF